MPDRPSRRPILVIASVTIALALLLLVAQVSAALQDGAWKARWLGFVMVAVALAVGVSIFLFARPGENAYWGVVGALTMAALVTGAFLYKPVAPQMGDRARKIPLVIGEWVGSDIQEDPEERANVERILQTTDIVMRSYRRGRDVVNLAVIHAQSKRKAAHPPEMCYAGEGYEMEEIATDHFTTPDGRTVDAKRLVIMWGRARDPKKKASSYKSDQAVLYWYRAGGVSTANFFWMNVRLILAGLNPFRTGGSSRVALIRLSTNIRTLDDVPAAMQRLREFARVVFPEIEKALGGN